MQQSCRMDKNVKAVFYIIWIMNSDLNFDILYQCDQHLWQVISKSETELQTSHKLCLYFLCSLAVETNRNTARKMDGLQHVASL